jgi:hypothetical protein
MCLRHKDLMSELSVVDGYNAPLDHSTNMTRMERNLKKTIQGIKMLF